MKTTIFIVSFLVLSFTCACQSMPYVTATPSLASKIYATETLPAITDGLHSISLAEVPRSQFKVQRVLSHLDTGNYIVFSNKYGQVQYFGMSDHSTGILFSFSNKMPEPVMLFNGRPIQFVFDEQRGSIVIKEDAVWFTDLFGSQLKNLQILPKPDVVCREPVFSPQGNWVLADCSRDFSHYLNFVDLLAKNNKTYQVECDEGAGVQIPGVYWSLDETKLLYF